MSVKLCLGVLLAVLCGMISASNADTFNSNDVFEEIESLLHTEISTASKYRQIAVDAPGSITVISREEIAKYGWRSLDEVLFSVRSFYLSNDLNYTYIGMRGFREPSNYNNRMLILVNGHRLNENIYGSSTFDNELGIDMNWVDRIEIVRGPTSSIYGTGGMLAVINVILKTGKHFDGCRISGEVSETGLFKGSGFVSREEDNGVDWFTAVQMGYYDGEDIYYEEFDSPETNNGIAHKKDFEKFYSTLFGINIEPFSLYGHLSHRTKGIPTAPWETIFNDDRTQTLDERAFLRLNYHKRLRETCDFTLSTYFDRYYYEGEYPFEDNVEGDVAKNLWVGSEAMLTINLFRKHCISLGMEVSHNLTAKYHLWDDEGTLCKFDKPFTQMSVTISDDFIVNKNVTLISGLRLDYYSNDKTYISPRLAGIWKPHRDSALKLIYSNAFRSPNLYETYYDDFGYAKRNEDLSREHIETFELIYERIINPRLFGMFSVFHYGMRELIEHELDPSDSLYQFINIEDVKANGFEMEIDGKLAHNFNIVSSYGYQESYLVGERTSLYDSPKHIFKLRFHRRLGDNFSVFCENVYETKRKTLQDTWTDEALITNLTLSYDYTRIRNSKIMLKVRNIFDRDYWHPAGYEHTQSMLKQKGRDIRLFFSVDF